MRFKLTWPGRSRRQRRREDRRAWVVEDVARCAGWMAALVAEAEALDLPVPELARGCVRAWRRWGQYLEGQRGSSPQGLSRG
jgi:hypothetical protein